MDSSIQMDLLYTIFDPSLPRLGPGDGAATRRAADVLLNAMTLATASERHADPRALDLGCGNGTQTLQLLHHTDWHVTAIDNHGPFLDTLRKRAAEQGVADRVRTIQTDMKTLDFDSGTFDIVWSEGALYIMGVANALDECLELLAEDGVMAYTDLCWLRSDPPAECRDFLEAECAEILDVESSIEMIGGRGYDILDYFTLPESAWTEDYYEPLEARLTMLRKREPNNADLLEMVESVQAEIDLFRTYAEYYGYVFYCLKLK